LTISDTINRRGEEMVDLYNVLELDNPKYYLHSLSVTKDILEQKLRDSIGTVELVKYAEELQTILQEIEKVKKKIER
jgi:hypothetical protein